MDQICSYFTTGVCNKRKCEVHLFLNDFINRVYNTNLREIGFRCLDISGADGKRPEISFILGGQKIVIEAKTLVNQETNTTISFTKKIGELLENFKGKSKEMRRKINLKKSVIRGVKLTFDETILSLSPILLNKHNKAEQEDLTSRILTAVYNKTHYMKKSNEFFGSVTIDISKYKKLKYDDLKKIKKTLYSRPEIDYSEDINLEHNFIKHYIKTEEYIRSNEKKINISLQLIDASFATELNCSVLNSTFATPTKQLISMINEAEEKLQKCNDADKKILFFNNNFYRLMESEIDDGYNELIHEIRNNVKGKNIDEVWIEYTEIKSKDDHFDYIEAIAIGRKGYERIYPYDETAQRFF